MSAPRRITYAVADLHGRCDVLHAALAMLMVDAVLRPVAPGVDDGAPRTVVFLGDYVDRGPDSRGVITRLMAGPPPGWRWICLAGNHDQSMVDACSGGDLREWYRHGGRATLASYGPVDDDHPFAAVPAAHLMWLAALPVVHADGRRVFVHGGVNADQPLAEQDDDRLRRKRYADDDPGFTPLGHVVHGHKSNPNGPLLQRGRTGLDTKAWATGRLVIGVFDDDREGGPVDFLEVLGPPAPAEMSP